MYNRFKADIFSLGVRLYDLYIGNKPFKETLKTDSSYKFIIHRNYNNYWTTIASDLKGIKNSKDLMILKIYIIK